MKRRIIIIVVGAFSTFLLVLSFFVLSQHPRHDRNWEVGQEKLPRFLVDGNRVRVENFRDFIWHDDGSVERIYRTEEFDLTQLNGADVIISHFDEYEGMAHIFVSFGFRDGKNMVISVETRREHGEIFSPWRGLMRRFEIIYIVGSERDVIGLRTSVRNERVYIYPTVATPQQSQQLLSLLMQDVNVVFDVPVFYNTIFNNCTNAITRRVEKVSNVKFPLTYKILFPGFFDEVLYEMKLIPYDKSFTEIKSFYHVENDRVLPVDANYSQKIRQR